MLIEGRLHGRREFLILQVSSFAYIYKLTFAQEAFPPLHPPPVYATVWTQNATVCICGDSDTRPGLIHHHNVRMDTKKPLLDTYLIKNHLPISG